MPSMRLELNSNYLRRCPFGQSRHIDRDTVEGKWTVQGLPVKMRFPLRKVGQMDEDIRRLDLRKSYVELGYKLENIPPKSIHV